MGLLFACAFFLKNFIQTRNQVTAISLKDLIVSAMFCEVLFGKICSLWKTCCERLGQKKKKVCFQNIENIITDQ